jgi:hypothetical protein
MDVSTVCVHCDNVIGTPSRDPAAGSNPTALKWGEYRKPRFVFPFTSLVYSAAEEVLI